MGINEFEIGGFSDPTPGPAEPTSVPESAPAPVAEASPAVQRFQSCRWRKAAENGTPDHCTHRDVHPMTGTTGFDAEAWCGDCAHYKIKRTPRKPTPRPPNNGYYY